MATKLEKVGGRAIDQVLEMVEHEEARRVREQLVKMGDDELNALRKKLEKKRRRSRRLRRERVLESPYRSVLRGLQRLYTLGRPANATQYGNYVLVDSALPKNPVVYSAGVGGDISFDEAVASKLGATVHLFDPTPRSIAFMQKQPKREALHFHPWAVYTRDGAIDMYFDYADSLDRVSNASAINISASAQSFRAKAYTVPTLMKRLGHDRIDVLKMDIEGAAPAVLSQTLEAGINPRQILCEFERPVGFHRVEMQVQYLNEVWRTLKLMRSLRYDIHRIRNSVNERQLEVLAIRSEA